MNETITPQITELVSEPDNIENLRDHIALAIIAGVFSRESQTKMDVGDKVSLSDFIWNTANIILERRKLHGISEESK